MKVLVCGDRNWACEHTIRERLKRLPTDTVVIEGGARGADLMSRGVAESLGFKVVEVRADWKRYGRAAGPRRNREMLDMDPELVLAFHPDLSKSKGTADTVREAGRRSISVEVIAPAATQV